MERRSKAPSPPVVLRRYKLPSVNHEGWALVVLGSDGFFSAVSDYGNYAYIWGAPGCEFRRFLISCDSHYFWSKIVWGRESRVFDEEQTTKNVSRRLWEMMGEGKIDKPQEEEALERLDRAFGGCDDPHHALAEWADDLGFEFDYIEGIYATKPEPQSWDFATKILPRLKEALRAELAAEGVDAIEAAS